MKSKLFGIVSVVALLSIGGVLLWQHSVKHATAKRETPIQHAPPPNTLTSVPASSPVARPVPARIIKMAVVTGTSSPDASVESSSSDAWSLIQTIVDGQKKYDARLDALDHLPRRLGALDREKLQKFLQEKSPLDHGTPGQALKNRAMDILCALNPPPAGLEQTLIQIYHDLGQDEVLRDYAVQHLAIYYEQIAAIQPDANNAAVKEAIRGAFTEALRETRSTIAGTTLLALKRLSQDHPEFDPNSVTALALQMAGDISAGEQTHITAFQLCAQLGSADALPVIAQAARNGETLPVRISAVAALGLLGGTDQISFLNSLLQGDEERLKPAARHALDQITRRQKQLASQN
jgi:hypothetical protein